MHPCPCCGYTTLPTRGGYDLCPVCWWEDHGVEPWEFSDANGTTLVEAQQAFLRERRPYRLRPGRVRAPRKREARPPGWQPLEVTDEVLARVRESHRREEQMWADHDADVVEGPADSWIEEYNAAYLALVAEAGDLSYRELRTRLRDLSHARGLMLGPAEVELIARGMHDERWMRRHPVRAAIWLVRYTRPSNVRRRVEQVRSGTIHVAG